MKILPIQEAYSRKFERQRRIPQLEYHASGHCVHIGKLSPGCYRCFVPEPYQYNILTGRACTLKCLYCPVFQGRSEQTKKEIVTRMAGICYDSLEPDFRPSAVSFSGGGEPLFHLDVLSGYMSLFRQIEGETGVKPWYYLYTNGLLAERKILLKLKEMGFDEIRFHIGASNFSKKVYRHMAEAVRHFKAVTVETPAWPPHRKKLFEMLPMLEEMGVKHLNIGEVMVNRLNIRKILEAMPNAEIYECYEMHLDDGGLVYDILGEVLRSKYSYSVLDCNSFVKSIQRAPGKWKFHEEIKGLCAEYRR